MNRSYSIYRNRTIAQDTSLGPYVMGSLFDFEISTHQNFGVSSTAMEQKIFEAVKSALLYFEVVLWFENAG